MHESIFDGWEQVVPEERIHVISVPGTHQSMMKPPQIETLGKLLSAAICGASSVKLVDPKVDYQPLVTIQAGRPSMVPVYCVPGAGDNSVTFCSLAVALGPDWQINGFQPRGLDGVGVPHSTVSAAAQAYLRAITQTYPEGPLHLIGHSFGGWVVFEMALQLHADGREIASVTLIDVEAPEGDSRFVSEYNRTEVFGELVELMTLSSERTINLAAADFEGLNYTRQLELLHRHFVAAKLMPPRSTPEGLRGMVRTFATHLRTTYVPSVIYPGPVRLVLVHAATDDATASQSKDQETAAQWRRFAPELVTWRGPGNHMTILNPPHVAALAEWWREGLEQKR